MRATIEDASSEGGVGRLLMMIGLSLTAVIANAQSSGVMYDGFTEPAYDLMVAATEIGRLDHVAVKVGDRVREGDVLARLEDTLQVSTVKLARMQASMRGDVDAARAERDLQLSRVTKLRALRLEAMTRPDEVIRGETELRIAEARLATAEEQSQLRQLEFERAELQLDRRLIRAPRSGIISEVLHEAGEFITPSDPAVARLIVTDTIYGVFNVPAEDTPAIRPGTPASVFIRSTAKTLAATVDSLSPEIDGESGTVQVRVALPNEDGQLRIGDRCTLRIVPSARESAFSLPRSMAP